MLGLCAAQELGRSASRSSIHVLPLQRQRHSYSSCSISVASVDMAEQFDEESQMRAARAEIMAVSDMFHRYFFPALYVLAFLSLCK